MASIMEKVFEKLFSLEIILRLSFCVFFFFLILALFWGSYKALNVSSIEVIIMEHLRR